MRTFLSFLSEGGNIHAATGPRTEPWDASNRAELKRQLHGFAHSVADAHHKTTGQHLFGPKLDVAGRASGSTHHIFDQNISDREIQNHLPEIGDADFRVSDEDIRHLNFKNNASSPIAVGKVHGDFTIVHVQKGKDLSVVVRNNKSGKHHQIDFSGSPDPDDPSAVSRTKSNWPDRKLGIKAYHTNALLASVARAAGNPLKLTDSPEEIAEKVRYKGNPADLEFFENVAKRLSKLPKEHHATVLAKYHEMANKRGRSPAAENILRRIFPNEHHP